MDESSPLFVTPYIRSGKLLQARESSKVKNLQNGFITVESYSGYFTINKEYNSNTFFWFFPAMNGKTDVPLILWLQGGPGASCSVGIFNQHGPFKVDSNLGLQKREVALNKEFAVLYVDNPFGAGFSFTENPLGYAKCQTDIANDLYEMLSQFFQLFNEYKNTSLWIAGESYGGKFATTIAHKIHSMGNDAKELGMNLTGILIGSGFCDPRNMLNYDEMLFQMGYIDDAEREYFKLEQAKIEKLIDNGSYADAFHGFNELIHKSIYGLESHFSRTVGFKSLFDHTSMANTNSKLYCDLLKQKSICKEIHVGGIEFEKDKFQCQKNLIQDFLFSVKPLLETLLDSDYPILFWNGNLDILIAPVITENYLKKLQWKGSNRYYSAGRKILKLDEKSDYVDGYIRNVDNLTFAIIRNAGHLTFLDKPETVIKLMTDFINEKNIK
ncbi:hypothetical protein BLOT_008984 [Blomia tropicalis]|nr:hypothetical protein BLOT_008984 [Blomia tropicalis]